MNRTYIFRRLGISRGLTVLAALAAGALLAGCGGGGGAATPAAGPSVTPTPVVSSGGVQAGAVLPVQTDAGSSGASASDGGGSVAGSVSGGGRSAAGTVSGGNAKVIGAVSGGGATGSVSQSKTGSFSTSSVGTVESASKATQQADAGAKNQASSGTSTTSGQTSTTSGQTSTITGQTSTTSGQTSTTRTISTQTTTPTKTVSTPATPPKTRTIVRFVNRYKVHTVYRTRTKTKTVTKTVVKQVAPNLPVGAFLPSKHPELAQGSFTVGGSNIGCQINGGTVRCAVQNRAWAAPAQPVSCKHSWGNTIQLGGRGMALFPCGGRDPISANAKVIPAGWDDKSGKITCEIRRFGVNCFSTTRRGFTISRTGYSLY
jgi:hypothetical protein